jgi:protein associated with RNAse G/E
MIVVKDSPNETVLALLPGTECMAEEDYARGKKNDHRRWDFIDKPWKLGKYSWQTNRLLFILEPQKYYATIYFWSDLSNEFICYYINFQLPFQRSHCGIDTLDLELDLIINPDFSYEWKDLDEYQKGIESGIISKEWTDQIELAKEEIFERIGKRKYPLDGTWLDWKPDPNWPRPKLPENWSKV